MLRHRAAEEPGLPSSALLPPTVQAVITERIDHLEPAARTLARRAAVFPRSSFSLQELRVAEPTNEALAELEEEELFEHEDERPRRLALPARDGPRRRVREPAEARVAAVAHAGRRYPEGLRGGGAPAALDRVPPRAGRAGRARPRPDRPGARRPCRRGAGPGGRRRARGAGHPGGRGRVPTGARSRRSPQVVGDPRGADPACLGEPVLARRVRPGGPGARACPRAGGERRRGARSGSEVPRRHRAVDPRE